MKWKSFKSPSKEGPVIDREHLTILCQPDTFYIAYPSGKTFYLTGQLAVSAPMPGSQLYIYAVLDGDGMAYVLDPRAIVRRGNPEGELMYSGCTTDELVADLGARGA